VKFSPSQASLPMRLDVRRTDQMQPFSDVGSDLWQIGDENYVVLVDRFSGFILCNKIKDKTSSSVIAELVGWMETYHPIMRLRTDGGPCYKSREFDNFCLRYGIIHEVSSSYFPQSDGLAENSVNVCKRLYRKSRQEGSDFKSNLQVLNNFPRLPPTGFKTIASPAEMFFGTAIRDFNPRLGSAKPDIEMSCLGREKNRSDMRQRSHRANVVLQPFVRGDTVWIQDTETKFWDVKGRIMYVRPSGLSYHILKENGRVSLRNRKYLRPRHGSMSDDIDLGAENNAIVESGFWRPATGCLDCETRVVTDRWQGHVKTVYRPCKAHGGLRSCLNRVVTDRVNGQRRKQGPDRGIAEQKWERSTVSRRRVTFSHATRLWEAVCVGAPVSVTESIRLAVRVSVKI
jgi:transposase InsO family protein